MNNKMWKPYLSVALSCYSVTSLIMKNLNRFNMSESDFRVDTLKEEKMLLITKNLIVEQII